MATKSKDKKEPDINITATNSSVVIGCSGNNDINNGAVSGTEGGEMENDLVRVFRGFSMRERVKFMQHAYDYEDQCAEDREREKKK